MGFSFNNTVVLLAVQVVFKIHLPLRLVGGKLISTAILQGSQLIECAKLCTWEHFDKQRQVAVITGTESSNVERAKIELSLDGYELRGEDHTGRL